MTAADISIEANYNVPVTETDVLSAFSGPLVASLDGRALLIGGQDHSGNFVIAALARDDADTWTGLGDLSIRNSYNLGDSALGNSAALSWDGMRAAVAIYSSDRFNPNVVNSSAIMFQRVGDQWRFLSRIQPDPVSGTVSVAMDTQNVILSNENATQIQSGGFGDAGKAYPVSPTQDGGSKIAVSGTALFIGQPGSTSLTAVRNYKLPEGMASPCPTTETLTLSRALGDAGLAVAPGSLVLIAGSTLANSLWFDPKSWAFVTPTISGQLTGAPLIGVAASRGFIAALTQDGAVATVTPQPGGTDIRFTKLPKLAGATAIAVGGATVFQINAQGAQCNAVRLKATKLSGPDVFIRDNFDDTGDVPVEGTLYLAPDVICQSGPSMHPKRDFVDRDWDKSIFEDPTSQDKSYFYVRAENRGDTGTNAKVHLYCVPATSFITPEHWETVGELDLGWVGPHDKAVNETALRWRATSHKETHRCFIAALFTDERPYKPPSEWGISNYSEWNHFAKNNNWICFHNSNIGSGFGSDTPSGRFFVSALDLDNARYRIQVAPKNVPAGAQLACVLEGASAKGGLSSGKDHAVEYLIKQGIVAEPFRYSFTGDQQPFWMSGDFELAKRERRRLDFVFMNLPAGSGEQMELIFRQFQVTPDLSSTPDPSTALGAVKFTFNPPQRKAA